MDIATIITTVGSAIGTIWLLKSDMEKKFDKINERFDKVDDELKGIRQELSHTNERISRIEGYIEGRDMSQKRKTGS